MLIRREDDGFVAYCPELSLSTGKEATEERARTILKEEIALAFLVDHYIEPTPRRLKRKRKISRSMSPVSERLM